METETIFSAARVLLPRGVWLAPGALSVRGGRIEEIGEPRALRARSPAADWIELADCALLPGLINAHAHLELSGLGGRLPRGAGFGAWVREVVRLRSQSSDSELEDATLDGARLALAGGATTVADLDATGCAERAWAAGQAQGLPRVVLFREFLDARKSERTSSEMARIEAPRACSEFHFAGLAPHAPHTVSPALLAALARAGQAGALPMTTHWSETPEEVDWLERGLGPFVELLGDSPRCSGLDLLDRAGVLGPKLALVHGNRARADEVARVARARATLVHCPGSHAFFDREPFPMRSWLEAGVPVALGTDSLASNASLDMRRELARCSADQPWLAARDALDAATVHGARALGLEGRVGAIAKGAFADLLAVPAAEIDGERCLERLAHGEFDVRQVWIGGRAVDAGEGRPQ